MWDDCTEDDLRTVRVLDENGNETAVIICGECGEEWEPPPGEDGFICFDCYERMMEEEAGREAAEEEHGGEA